MSNFQKVRSSILAFKFYYIKSLRFICTGSVSAKESYDFQEPYIPKSSKELQEILKQKPNFPPDSKLLKIAIIGVPNCGKSTLINQLVRWKVCSVSHKVHTTTCNARALTNDGDVQLIFLDTPGIVTPEEIKKHKLKNTLIIGPESSLEQADCIGVLHDVSNRFTRDSLHHSVLRLLALYPTIPSVLILNKIDVLKRKELLLSLVDKLTGGKLEKYQMLFKETNVVQSREDLAAKLLSESNYFTPKNVIEPIYNVIKSDEEYPDIYESDPINMDFTTQEVLDGKIKLTENQVQQFVKDLKTWPKFSELFMVSALEGTGVENLRNHFLSSAVPAPWMFNDDFITDQAPQDIALQTVRSMFLEHLDFNIPYEFTFKLTYWNLSEADVINIIVSIHSKRECLYKYLLRKSGLKLKIIAREAEQELRDTFRTEVRLRLNVEVKPFKSNSSMSKPPRKTLT